MIYEGLMVNVSSMKTLIPLFLLAFVFLSAADEPVKPDCTCWKIKLYGKVKIVEHFPDFKVKAVDHFPDLNVKLVVHFPDECGEWELVENFPDFTVQFVENFPDFKIQFVDHFPGLP
jgi:hypothetical protein